LGANFILLREIKRVWGGTKSSAHASSHFRRARARHIKSKPQSHNEKDQAFKEHSKKIPLEWKVDGMESAFYSL
jgi:hypothetical protein